MNLTEMQESLLVTPGTYGVNLSKVELRPSKSQPGKSNISVTLEVHLDSGRTARVWDTLPPLTEAIAWRYAQYLKAFNLTINPTEEITTQLFQRALVAALDADVMALADIGTEQQKGYAPRNKVSRLVPMTDDIQSVLRTGRHDTDTDAPAQPSRLSSTGEQSSPAEDRNLV